ncbi:6-deoxy-6-sulfogluconolactonase [Defluviimonas aquaemixtae]|uniref:6-deoxy-6-sulfogluconolactonase n=1 Tax=Albidovulum aquaemixtae TaxID=1542388 RepID=A0A2R8B7Z3_9RHOB|nr:SMP-30/gluconolactonase/LRE family protein [Defluviimonas aquaemixtae]SPH18744.1 6-deoxy-6-sulfogluconolactonase [Defluviimonas aquaemixtae]
MSVTVFSATRCALGEGPMWHPERAELFWFDILGKRLHAKGAGGERNWQFDEHISAAGRIDRETLLIASETGLYRFDIGSGERSLVVALEADNPVTRSNDGRADPWGGFWIGTMGKTAERGAGAIYRFYRGELQKLIADVTISNSICFRADRSAAFYTDTRIGRIMRQPLAAADGWPEGEPEVFLDLGHNDALGVDGSVMDSEGCLWNAQWGASRVERYAPDGRLLETVGVPTSQASCPAFGGDDLKTLYITTAADGVKDDEAGKTYGTRIDVAGLADPEVVA